MLLRTSDNAEQAWPADGVIGAGLRPAVRLEWTSDLAGAVFTVGRKTRGGLYWKPVAGQGEYQTLAPTSFRAYDTGVDPAKIQRYRIRSISAQGVPSTLFHEFEVMPPNS